MYRFLLSILLFIGCLSPLWAAEQVEVITLKSRHSSEMLPIVQPLVAPDGSVSGFHEKLIIRAPAERMPDILRVVEQLDRPPRRLMISVRHGSGISTRSSGAGVSGRVRMGDDAEVRLGGPPSRGARVKIKEYSTSSQNQGEQRVQAVEGRAAFIQAGQSVPIHQTTTRVVNGVVVQEPSVRYRDVTQGFWVVPQLNGDTVTLAIHQHNDRPGRQSGTFDIQQADTVVRGRIGEWIDLGGVQQGHSGDGEGIAHRYQTRRQEDVQLQLRVTELP